jgi:arylsulfatase A-like enzyme
MRLSDLIACGRIHPILFSVWALLVAALPAAERPNVVIILADDLGYGDLACYGATLIDTPHCDRLASEGRRFTDAHSPSAVCSPTRFGLLTGMYPWRGQRVPRHLHAWETLVIREGEATIASLLQSAGYATGCFGKWHLGAQRGQKIDWTRPLKPGPNDVGFDEYFGVINSHNQAPFVWVENDRIFDVPPGTPIEITDNRVQSQGPRTRVETDAAAIETDRAVKFIDRHHARPFFLYFPTSAVHDPITPGAAMQGKSRAGSYGDYVQEFDWQVGQVLAALDRHGIADRTIVVVTSDNGGIVARGAKTGHKPVGLLRGQKGTAYEGGHRVPFIVRWPGRVPAGSTSDAVISHVDLMATVCDAVGVPLPPDAGPDSVSALAAWRGEPYEPARSAIVSVSQNAAEYAVRSGAWKLIVAAQGMVSRELYQLSKDPSEQTNLLDQHPDQARDLSNLLRQYIQTGRSRP